jgi:hypothetical protein
LAGQKKPTGQTCGALELAGQKKPGGHGSAALAPRTYPLQLSTAVACRSQEKLPQPKKGHWCSSAERDGPVVMQVTPSIHTGSLSATSLSLFNDTAFGSLKCGWKPSCSHTKSPSAWSKSVRHTAPH